METVDWSSRLAGAVVVLVGVLNAGVGLLTVMTDLVRLSPGVGGGFLAVGLVTVAVGVLVWRGHWLPTIVVLTLFAMLLVFQVGELAASDPRAAGGMADTPMARLAVLAILVASLGLATIRTRARGRRHEGRRGEVGTRDG